MPAAAYSTRRCGCWPLGCELLDGWPPLIAVDVPPLLGGGEEPEDALPLDDPPLGDELLLPLDDGEEPEDALPLDDVVPPVIVPIETARRPPPLNAAFACPFVYTGITVHTNVFPALDVGRTVESDTDALPTTP